MQDSLYTTTRKILSVTQLTEDIKNLLEDRFSMIWISGETSNLRIPASGHAYFTLKDRKAQISAVMFQGQLRQLKFDLDNGMNLIGLGRITVYPPRGNYQVIFEYAEPQGVGALQVAFEQLKTKLESEGLFAAQYKKALPFLPSAIGVITSSRGSVVQDILKVISRRFHHMPIDIYPVRVQGSESTQEIISALSLANQSKRNDVLIIARGGGSIEDLAPFNSEDVARAIFASQIPVVSAVGHETDFTIADFVSDLRAPTPSAAAQMIVPDKEGLQDRIIELKQRTARSIREHCQRLTEKNRQLRHRIVHPNKKTQEARLHLDQLTVRLERAAKVYFQKLQNRFHRTNDGFMNNHPLGYVNKFRAKTEVALVKLMQGLQNHFQDRAKRYKMVDAVLKAVNPTAILKRGYSITRILPGGKLAMDANELSQGQLLEIQLSRGKVDVSVIRHKVKPIENEE